MGIKCGRVEAFHDDQLAVALPDEELVARTLAGLGVRIGQTERSPVLGLALMRGLANVDQAVAALLDSGDIGPELRQFRHERARSQAGASGADVASLILLIKGIHLRFARDYPGWKVTIGKNYRPSPVKGYPHIGGGNGDPQPTDATLGPASPEDEPATGPGNGVRVGLLDTRLYPHPWFADRYLARRSDLLDSDRDTFTVFDGHSAFVASCILREAPAAELYVHQVLDGQGDGTAWEAAVAMAETAQTGMDVVNLSFGEFLTDDNTAPMIFDAAIRQFSPETVLVAAAGNNGDVDHLSPNLVPAGLEHNTAAYPAAHVNVVGVGALDRSGHRAAFTPDPAPWISLLAPGVGLTGAYVRGVVEIEHKDNQGHVLDSKQVAFPGTAIWEGCSFAAGVVSGAIAARTVPGRRSAREALEELLHPDPGQPDGGIVPNRPGR
jgi:membrane-anchored mycosin MYCP